MPSPVAMMLWICASSKVMTGVPMYIFPSNGQVQGTRLFCFSIPGDGYNICAAIMNTLAPITPGSSDNIATARFAEILQANAPTAYIEVAFHDNAEEAQWIIDHKKDIAEAIVNGLCNYYGMKYVAPSEESEQPSAPASKKVGYRVQVGYFEVKANAERLRDELKGNGYDAFIVEVAK